MTDFSRNLGLISADQQQQLSAAHIAVCGVGGMGGVAAEALCRMGVGSLTLLDHDHYEASNINRQMHCTQATLGQSKVKVVGQRLREINPDLKLTLLGALTESTAHYIGAKADLIINGMDDVLASITLERTARSYGRTIVDAWITPYASVLVMTADSPHWEAFLHFPTVGKPLSAITPADVQQCLRREVAFTLSQFDPRSIIDAALIERILQGTQARPSLVPVVWMSGVLLANEAMKILTHQGRLATHWGVFYNQYEHVIRYLDYTGKVGDSREETNHATASTIKRLAG